MQKSAQGRTNSEQYEIRAVIGYDAAQRNTKQSETKTMPEVNYLRDVQPFDDNNGGSVWSDADIATQLNSQSMFAIGASSGRQVFALVGWWYQNQDGSWAGTMQSIQDDPSAPQSIKEFIAAVWLRVYGAASTTCGTELIYDYTGAVDASQLAADWSAMFTWGNANGHAFVPASIATFYQNGGDLKYLEGDVAAADVTASRNAYNEGQALQATKDRLAAQYNALYNEFISPIYTSDDPAIVTDATVKAGLQSMHDDWIDGA